MTRFNKLKTAILIIIIGCPVKTSSQYVYSEVAVKAAYIMNIMKFVEFGKGQETLELCIVGDDLLGLSAAKIQNESDAFNNIKITKKAINSSYKSCNVIYISKAQIDDVKTILYKADSVEALTISDIENFSENRGMIELVTQDNKVNFTINKSNIERVNIKISAKIYQMAKQIYQ